MSGIAGFVTLASIANAETKTATFTFAQVGSSFSAFLPSDSPLIGKQIISARIYLDVESFEGSDAANFFTDISFPIVPDPGNTNALVLVGSDLGWSGSGIFHYFEETTGLNGVFVSARYGGETPGENFDGLLLDTSRIEFDYIEDGGADLALESAASRKTHGHIGVFDLPLPLTGAVGIESRFGNGKSEIVFTFNNNVTAVGDAATTCGKLGKIMIDPNDAHNVLVRLNESVCDESEVTVTVTGITDDQGHTLDSAAITFGVLFGDVNADGIVDDVDIAAARAVEGQRTDSSNYRADITADGGINRRDIGEVKNYYGTTLP
jgi:Dockerin type I domain